MRLTDLANYLTNFLSGDMKAETEKTLENLGFVPKDQAAAGDGGQHKPEDVEKIKTDAKAEGHEAGKSEGHESGKKEANERACEILDMCNLAGMPGKAAELIKSDKTVADAKKDLVNAQADAGNQAHIQSTVSPTGTGEVNPLAKDAEKRAEAAKASRQ